MIIRWLENARFDLQALQQHIALDNSLAANRMAKHIFNTVNLLSEQPALGRHGRIPHTRELIISNTPYIVLYQVKNNTIEILRIFHAARQWPTESFFDK